ncbi:anti-sigma regulatory factor (plasmid) [Deinococcus psychrotolerans]|uniref:Anti-sigma regulatory factor n=1 Tax=Deinococcus psychrotolerans TaxID=2489213 RepID=A0A3G8YJP1_9DEIO|nr:ATP-binding protein [Deinococcus psychrotolerans]AZI45115.1 anti-sigma regulatory factor [Deinococcus psychrotolerans]
MTTPTPENEVLPVGSEDDVVRVRQAVRRHAITLGFSLVDQTKLVTAASELARNVLIHGLGGQVRLEPLPVPISGARPGLRPGLRMVFEDQGPGIPDLDRALQDGFTTGNGLGLGLSGSRRLMNEFSVESRPGETRITVVKWKA